MNSKKLFIWGFLFMSVIGTLLHFVYEWSGNNSIVRLFAPWNESTWEHMKLLFFPMLVLVLFPFFQTAGTKSDSSSTLHWDAGWVGIDSNSLLHIHRCAGLLCHGD